MSFYRQLGDQIGFNFLHPTALIMTELLLLTQNSFLVQRWCTARVDPCLVSTGWSSELHELYYKRGIHDDVDLEILIRHSTRHAHFMSSSSLP